MTRLAVDYQNEVNNALEGRYSEEAMHPSKVRMHIQNDTDHFNNIMQKKRSYTGV